MNDYEKELIRQGLDLLIAETEYNMEHGARGLKQYRKRELEKIKKLRSKIVKNEIE